MEDYIIRSVRESAKAAGDFFNDNLGGVMQAVEIIVSALKSGNKIMFFGNGGSAADCQHLAAEFVNRFQIERPPLPALALSTDTSILTSIGNDYSFEDIFAKQIRALGKMGDVAIGITTSGNSANIIKALEEANRQGIKTIAFLGKDGGMAKKAAFLPLIVTSKNIPRIQETHILLGHIICEMVDIRLFQKPYEQ